MIKEALQYLVGMKEVEIFCENGQTFADKSVHLLEYPTADAITVHSLSGLVEYLKSDFDTDGRLMVHVVSPTEVVVFDEVNGDMNRNKFIKAQAMLPKFHFDNWYNSEDFIIKLQSTFVNNGDREIMLKVIGNIKEEDVRTTGDDGVSQAVTAKTGVATVGNVKVPNPVELRPYRTFVDVEQPESEFIFRMQSGPRCALFEADGGAWKLDAINNIANYLEEALSERIAAEKIVIIA